MLMLKRAVVGLCSNFVQNVDQEKSVKDSISQFPNFGTNFHKFHTLFSVRLSQLIEEKHRFRYMYLCSHMCLFLCVL
jgi:hypothetical protein